MFAILRFLFPHAIGFLFSGILKEMCYKGNVSIEAGTDDLLHDGRRAVEVLREVMVNE